MTVDRAAALKNAEKFLRQGKLEPAIGEYLKVVDAHPRDWGSANTLGDLYIRANQVSKAIDQYVRIADSLNEEGFLPKAAALYKKILKLKPDHEHAMLQAADIASSQGLYADARGYLGMVAEKRAAAGDKRGSAQIRIRIGNLDPADYDARTGAALARVEINDTAGAIRDLKEIAQELTEKDRQPEALEALRKAGRLAPHDADIRNWMIDLCVAADDFAGAREWATSADQLKQLAAKLAERGRTDEAVALQRDAARMDPADADLRINIARALVERGDMAAAAEYLTEESAGGDPQLLLALVEMRLRGGQVDDAIAIARRLLIQEGGLRDRVAMLGWRVAEQSADSGFALVELAADVAVASGDWANAAAALQEFVTRVPSHIPALMRLVEICVDGGLEATLDSAQGQLADAYITAGMAEEARFISEDLVAREPWERSNVERFRRALVLMNEPDPDAVIADRLSGQSPFTSTDLNAIDFPPFEPPPAPEREAAAAPSDGGPDAPADGASEGGATPTQPGGVPDAARHSVDTFPSGLPGAAADAQAPEVDLSTALDDGPQPTVADGDLESVFDQFRGEASRQSLIEAAESAYARALVLEQQGDIDGAVAQLEAASQAPALRFVTASRLGRLLRARGRLAESLEWLERAAQAPAPAPADYHQLLYELAEGLEATGETARALAICLELQADAGAYRDVAARVDRLTRTQARE